MGQQPEFTFWLIAGFNFFSVLLQIEAVVKCQNRQQIAGKINIRDKSEALVVCSITYTVHKYPPTLWQSNRFININGQAPGQFDAFPKLAELLYMYNKIMFCFSSQCKAFSHNFRPRHRRIYYCQTRLKNCVRSLGVLKNSYFIFCALCC